jgi:hypothetical protein
LEEGMLSYLIHFSLLEFPFISDALKGYACTSDMDALNLIISLFTLIINK